MVTEKVLEGREVREAALVNLHVASKQGDCRRSCNVLLRVLRAIKMVV